MKFNLDCSQENLFPITKLLEDGQGKFKHISQIKNIHGFLKLIIRHLK